MNRTLITIGLLCCSNLFLTFAWYGRLKNLSHKPWIVAALVSWGIAFFEYLLQTCQPDRPHGTAGGTAQDHSGGNHPHGLRSVFAYLPQRKNVPRLSMGRPVSVWRSFFSIPNPHF
jgi:hypothetical protein